MAKTSPTQRSLKWLRAQGMVVHVTEHWNAFARRRVDAFGFIDILVAGGTKDGIIGVQTTSRANLSARRKKILELPEAVAWLKSRGRIVLHGWAKPAKSRSWEVKVIEMTMEDFNEQPVGAHDHEETPA